MKTYSISLLAIGLLTMATTFVLSLFNMSFLGLEMVDGVIVAAFGTAMLLTYQLTGSLRSDRRLPIQPAANELHGLQLRRTGIHDTARGIPSRLQTTCGHGITKSRLNLNQPVQVA